MIAEKKKMKTMQNRLKSMQNRLKTIECFAHNVIEVPEELAFLENGDSVQSHVDTSQFGLFRIMSEKDGDKRVIWNRNSIAEISAAKKMFMDLLSKGMIPYKVGLRGEATSSVMDEFDPTAEEVIFLPVKAIAGG